MKTMPLLFCALFATSALAEKPLTLPVVSKRQTTADLSDIKVISAKTVVENKYGNYEDRYIEITLGMTAVASACETMKSIEYTSAQASLDSGLNPSDFYLKVNTQWKKDCATGSFGTPQEIRHVVKFSIDQREASEAGKPWPKPTYSSNENIRHFNFDAGMMGGYNRLSLYKLNYGDLDNITFEFVKRFSLVQGQIVE